MRSCATFNKVEIICVERAMRTTVAAAAVAAAAVAMTTQTIWHRRISYTEPRGWEAGSMCVVCVCGEVEAEDRNMEKVKLNQHDKCITIAIVCIEENAWTLIFMLGRSAANRLRLSLCQFILICLRNSDCIHSVLCVCVWWWCEHYNLIIMNAYALKQTIN